MQERQSATDHPRSDDVKGRDRQDDDHGGGDQGATPGAPVPVTPPDGEDTEVSGS